MPDGYRDEICFLIARCESSPLEELIQSRLSDVNAATACGFRPLSLALKVRCAAAVRILLQHGANVNLSDNASGEATILDEAVTSFTLLKEPAQLLLLLEGGLKVDHRHSDGDTLLMRAVLSSRELVELLLRRGADPNLRDRHGRSALLLAAMTDASSLEYDDIVSVIRALLSFGASRALADERGNRPVDVARLQSVKEGPEVEALLKT